MTFINLNDLNDPNAQNFLISASDLTENNLFARGVPRHSEDSEVIADALTGWLYDHADAWLFAEDTDAAIAVIEAFWTANPIWDERYPALFTGGAAVAAPSLFTSQGVTMKHIIGYARVSTVQQSTEVQQKALVASGCTAIYIDEAVSGSSNHDSPKFKAMMRRVEELRAAGDEVTVRVTKLDRFSRSLPHLLDNVERLGKLGASFEAADDSFVYDANSPTSVLMLSMLGALAQFERSLIKARMAEGRAYAKANGRIFGRRPALTQAAVDAIRKERAEEGTTDRQLAKKWDVSRTMIQRVLNIAGYTQPYVTADEWDAARKG